MPWLPSLGQLPRAAGGGIVKHLTPAQLAQSHVLVVGDVFEISTPGGGGYGLAEGGADQV